MKKLYKTQQVEEESIDQKRSLLAYVSNEIRLPLNTIIGFSEILINQCFGFIRHSRYIEYAHYFVVSKFTPTQLLQVALNLYRTLLC